MLVAVQEPVVAVVPLKGRCCLLRDPEVCSVMVTEVPMGPASD